MSELAAGDARGCTERPATVEDAEAIAALIRSLSSPFLASPDGAGAEGYFASVSAGAIAGYVSQPAFDYRVIEDAGRLVAVGAMRDGRHLHHLFVAASHQGRGLARRLWRGLHEAALARGHAGAFTVNASLGAQPVYARFGFVAAGDVQRVHGIAFRPMILEPATGPAQAAPDTPALVPGPAPDPVQEGTAPASLPAPAPGGTRPSATNSAIDR